MSIERPAIVATPNNGPRVLTNTILLLHRLSWRLRGLASQDTSNSNATKKALVRISGRAFTFCVKGDKKKCSADTFRGTCRLGPHSLCTASEVFRKFMKIGHVANCF